MSHEKCLLENILLFHHISPSQTKD